MCSLIPGLGVKLSTVILAGPTVLSAVGACPPHDGVRRRWRINLGVKLSTVILAGPTVLSAVGACPPHDGVRRRWRINVANAVVLSDARKKSDDLATATVPAGTTFPAASREPCDLLMRATRPPSSSTS